MQEKLIPRSLFRFSVDRVRVSAKCNKYLHTGQVTLV